MHGAAVYAMLMHAGAHPHVHGHEVAALVGMIVAAALALWAQRTGRL